MRRSRLVAAAGVAAAVLAPAWGPPVLRPFAFFRVRRVELVGARLLEPDQVVAALGLRRAASVWDRLGPMAARVKALPGVAEAVVSRRLPGTVRVALREVEPVALAAGDAALVPVGPDARPLPYDPAREAVDVPVVRGADSSVVAALVAVRGADPTLYSEVVVARSEPPGGIELELQGGGRVLLALPIAAEVVQSVAAVERDLAARSQPWRELDGRFSGWVVVRRPTRAEAKS